MDMSTMSSGMMAGDDGDASMKMRELVYSEQGASIWLRGLRTYLGVILAGNLLWESLHLPLYTIWRTGSLREQVFAVLHCTFGDLLIAVSTLTLALVIVGNGLWPVRHARRVAALTILFGVSYTIYSEWLNVVVRAAWAYSDLMPVISIGKITVGMSPLLQWILVPGAAAWIVHRRG